MSALNTDLEETVNLLRGEVEEAETLVNATQTELSTCTEELEREQCVNIEVQSELEEAKIREIFLQERISYLESSAPNQEQNVISQQQVAASGETDEEAENKILIGKLEKAKEELSKAKQNLEEQLSLLKVQSKEIDSLNAINSNLTDEKLGLEGNNVSLETAASSQNEQMAVKCSEIENLNKSLSSLRDENDIMRDQNSSVQSELEQIVAQLNTATDNNRQLTDKLNTRERDVLLAQESSSTLQERLSLLEREKEGERVELDSLRGNSASAGIMEQQLYSSQEECKQLKLKVIKSNAMNEDITLLLIP